MQAVNFGALPHKDLVSVADLSRDDITRIFDVAAELKAHRSQHCDLLRGKRLAMVFEKESLRTRFTFDIGMQDLGGSAVFLDHRDARLGSRESVPDMARNLDRWVHAIVARTYKHRVVTELAQHASVPVINGLTDFLHPCQALTDMFTLTEKWGDVRGHRIVYLGDGNNTCHSLMHAAAILGANLTVCTPVGYEPALAVMNESLAAAAASGAEIVHCNDPKEAAEGAQAIYTDVWASMGQEDEIEERAAIFGPYQVDEALMALTDDAYFVHCLPAHRGHEVTPGVIDGPRSIVFDVAENRLHVQKAILVLLLADQPVPQEVTA
ncbi:MAG: ornithine carbamoyltransferase [Planctomycetota bacterium]